MTIWQILDRYGYGSAGIVLLAVFIWKVLWPFISKLVNAVLEQSKRSEERLDKATSQFTEALKQREQRESKMVDDFVEALEKRDKVADRIIDSLDRIHDKIERSK